MPILRYEPIETGSGPDDLYPADFLIIEDGEVIKCVWQNENYTGKIGDKLPYVHGDAKKPHGQKPLFLLRWADKDGVTSESKTTFDIEGSEQDWGRIEIEFNGKFHGFKRVATDCRTRSPGEAHRYVVYFYERPRAIELTRDRQGRYLTQNTEMEFTAEDILDLAKTFEAWISIRETGRYLFLDRKGARFHQR